MLRVRPGVELVRASLVPTRELMTLDLPTLERPRKAISGRIGSREVRGVGGRRHKAGENPHAQVCNGGREVGKLKPRRCLQRLSGHHLGRRRQDVASYVSRMDD